MATRRQRRLNELLLEELSMLVPGRVDDPRLEDATITRVETTQDMGTAKVYFASSSPAEEADIQAMLSGLQHASSFLRQELGGLGLRRIPRLVFAHDRAYESGQRVLEILGKLGDDAGDRSDEMASGSDQDAPQADGSSGGPESQGRDQSEGESSR